MEHRPVDHEWKGHCLGGQGGRTSKGEGGGLSWRIRYKVQDTNIQSKVEKVKKVEEVRSLGKGRKKKEKGGKDEGIYSRAREMKEAWSSLMRISQSGKASHPCEYQ
ncbi:hypothetical protein N7504_005231 [Penicillium tannophilum]|nr:hypothetical protein N7504_005231 [Penicillium tannophilum]